MEFQVFFCCFFLHESTIPFSYNLNLELEIGARLSFKTDTFSLGLSLTAVPQIPEKPLSQHACT